MTETEKRGLVLDWIQETIDNQDEWKMYYSGSEVKTLAEFAMEFLDDKGT